VIAHLAKGETNDLRAKIDTDKFFFTNGYNGEGRFAKLTNLARRIGLFSITLIVASTAALSVLGITDSAQAQEVEAAVAVVGVVGISGLIAAGVGLVLAGVAAYFLTRHYILSGSWDHVVEQYNTRRVKHLKAGTQMPRVYLSRKVIPANLSQLISAKYADKRFVPADDLIYFNVDERDNAFVIYRWAHTSEAEELAQVHNDAWMTTPEETVTVEQLRSAVENNNKGIVVAQVIDKTTKRAFIGALIWSVDKYLSPELIETIRTQALHNGEAGNAGFLSTVHTLTNNFTLKGSIDHEANARFNFALGAPNVKTVDAARRDYYLVGGEPVKGLAGGLVKAQAAQAKREQITYLATYSPASAKGFHEHNGAVKWSIGELEGGRYSGMNAILMLYTPTSELEYVRERDQQQADAQEVAVGDAVRLVELALV
ncbi:MAG: hypothetical protein K8I00_10740, partial [Candidatus Omnitrophica bacterium]|nr:hypothetical protein [Candidatus Omnitrophota bacterium]